MPNRPNCWTHDDENTGSIFHELVVLPMLAPELAHPKYLLPHGEGPVPYPQPHSQQINNSVFPVNNHLPAGTFMFHARWPSLQPLGLLKSALVQTCSASHLWLHLQCLMTRSRMTRACTPVQVVSPSQVLHSSKSDIPFPVSDHQFFVNVSLEWVVPRFITQGPAKLKTTTDSKTGPPLAILGFSWINMVHSILDVHGLQDHYLLGPISGPLFHLACKGMMYINIYYSSASLANINCIVEVWRMPLLFAVTKTGQTWSTNCWLWKLTTTPYK